MNKSKTIKSIIASVLSFIMVLAPVSQVMAATDKEYVSEVVTGDSVKALEAKGYEVVDQDLNEKANGGVYLGYKTTTDPTKAITDLSIMDMNGGYSVTAYQNMLADKRSEIEEIVNDLVKSLKEFQDNYKAGTIQAKSAYETLNYYNEDDSKQKMGDFLVNLKLKDQEVELKSQLTDKEILKQDDKTIIKEAQKVIEDQEALAKNQLVKLIMESNQTILNAIIQQVALGCTDKDSSNTWLNRLSKVNVNTRFSNTYESDARMILEKWDDSSDAIFNSDIMEEELEDCTKDEATQYFKDLSPSEQSDLIVGDSIKNAVEDKKYNKQSMIDFFTTQADDLTVTDLYPLVSVLTPGQLSLAKHYGIGTVISNTVSKKSHVDKLNEAVKDTADEKDINKAISIYTGVDRRFFGGDVALTNEAMTKMNSSDNQTFWETDVDKRVVLAAAIIGSIGFVSLAVSAGCFIYQQYFAFRPTQLIAEEFFDYVLENGIQTVTNRVLVLSRCINVMALSIGIMLLATGLYLGVKWYTYLHPDYKDVPVIMVDERKDDNDNTFYVNYYGTENLKGKVGDLNNFKGKQWNVLYYTKDAKAGKPILATVFAQKGNKSSTKSGFVPVHGFSSTAAFNTNKNTFDNALTSNPPEVYLFFEQDEKALTGSTFSTGMLAIIVAVSVVAGAALGVGGTVLVSKRKREEKQAK